MAEISRNNTGFFGEYFVAVKLYRRDWSVCMIEEVLRKRY